MLRCLHVTQQQLIHWLHCDLIDFLQPLLLEAQLLSSHERRCQEVRITADKAFLSPDGGWQQVWTCQSLHSQLSSVRLYCWGCRFQVMTRENTRSRKEDDLSGFYSVFGSFFWSSLWLSLALQYLHMSSGWLRKIAVMGNPLSNLSSQFLLHFDSWRVLL